MLSNQQLSLATLLAKEIDQEVASRLDALERVAVSAEKDMKQGPAAMQRFLEARPVIQSMFNGGLIVYNPDGLAIANFPATDERVGTYLRDTELVSSAIGKGHVVIGKAFLGEKFDSPVFTMAAPIRDEHGGVIGIIVGEIELGLHNFLTATMTTPFGKSGGYLLIDRQARQIIMSTDRQRIMEKLPPPGVHPVIDHFLEGHEGTAVMINPLGQEMLVADKAVRSANWIISVVVPTKEAFAPIAAMKLRLLSVALLMTVLAAAMTWWFIRRQFAPLESSLKAMLFMRQPGQALKPLPIARPDEIGQLIEGFNAVLEVAEAREESLRESDDCLRSILETSLDGFWRVSQDGHLLQVNETYARMSGYTADELVGMHVSQLVAEESPVEAAERHAKILATGHLQFEDVHRRKDGSLWHIETSVSYRQSMGGQVVAFIRDIGERKRSEAALRDAERKFMALVQQSLVGVYIMRDSKWVYVNPRLAEMFGYTNPADYMTNCSVSDMVAPESKALVAENMRRRLSGEIEMLNYDFTALRKDGSRFQIEVYGSLIEYEGQPAIMGVAMDISERKRTEAELEQHRAHLEELVVERTRELAEARDKAESANRAKSAFLGNMSHELRTPLNHIAGFAALLERDVQGETGHERLAKLKKASDTLLALINELLDYSKLEADQIEIEEIDVDLRRLLDQVEQSYREVAGSKGIALVRETSPLLPPVIRGDALRLAQILGHLLGNAIKFSEHGTVTIKVSLDDARETPTLKFMVKDEGIGIAPELRCGLFNLFNQGDGSTTRRFSGTGLGLALCKRLVNLMAGDIGYSSAPTKGSSFWFSIPLIIPTAPVAPTGQGPDKNYGQASQEDFEHLASLLELGDLEAKIRWERQRQSMIPMLQGKAGIIDEAIANFDFETALSLLQEVRCNG